MRLLHAVDLKLKVIYDNIPPYAILSHTWGKDEVSLQEVEDFDLSFLQTKAGFRKIQACCQKALYDGLEYVWVDSCCIDKTNSTELSETINSMYRYFSDAVVCYTHLADVHAVADPTAPNAAFRRSKWFTRGWTLQELLVPPSLVFYSADWQEIGTRNSLSHVITEMTGIRISVLKRAYKNEQNDTCIGERMRWASNRKTTRIEDRAYSLLGIFGIFMPVIYGEGSNAFVRLQEEIIRTHDDHTIFAWRSDGVKQTGALLAESPDAFSHFDGMRSVKIDNRVSPYGLTNAGLRINVPIVPVELSENDSRGWGALAMLDIEALCDKGESSEGRIGIYVRLDRVSGLHERVYPDRLVTLKREQFAVIQPREIYIKAKVARSVAHEEMFQDSREEGFLVRNVPQDEGFAMTAWRRGQGSDSWEAMDGDRYFLSITEGHSRGALAFQDGSGERFVVMFGLKAGGGAYCDVVAGCGEEHLCQIGGPECPFASNKHRRKPRGKEEEEGYADRAGCALGDGFWVICSVRRGCVKPEEGPMLSINLVDVKLVMRCLRSATI